MTVQLVRQRACVLGFAWVWACTFDPKGQGGTAGELPPATTDAMGTTSAAPGPTSSGSGDVDSAGSTAEADGTTVGPPATDSGSESTDTGEPPVPFPTGPFGRPQPLIMINDAFFSEDDPTLTLDGLELYFESDRTGFGDIYVARRESVDDPWQAPELVPGIGVDGASDGTPGLTDDGLTMFFSSNRPGPFPGQDIYMTGRGNLKAAWGPAARVDGLSSMYIELGPHPLPGGEGMFVCSDRPGEGAGQLSLWLVEDTDFANGLYSPPVLVAPLSTEFNECMLMQTTNGHELVFDTDRLPSVGLVDLWSATRDEIDGSLGEPFALENVNSPLEERDPWISPDGHELYFSSNRDGSFDIFVATR